MAVHDPHLAEARRTLCRHFPAPFPGETIFSACARFHGLSAMKRPALTGLLLLGSSRAASKRCAPVGLGTLIKCLPDLFSSVHELLQQHTHAALYLRFMTQDQRARCIAACLSSTHRRERLPFGWASANFERQHPLRFCRMCSISDEAQYGRAFWHLNHQFPGALVCAEHSQPLRVAAPLSSRNEWVLPTMSNSSQPGSLHDAQLSFLVCLADTVRQLCGPTRANLDALRAHLCLQLEQAGVAQACRALNEDKLRQWISMHIGSLEGACLNAFEARSGADSVAGILGKRLAHHPLRWALLITCLRLEGAPLEPIVLALQGPIQRPLPGFKIHEAPASPQMAFNAVACGAEIREIAKQTSVSRAVVERWLSDAAVHEAWSLARRRKIWGRHEASIRDALASGSFSRQALRTRASAAYQWFQRNDPSFLESVLPLSTEQQQLPLWS